MVPYKIVIPARYSSKRFPGKMLAMIEGKPLIQHTYEHVIQCSNVDEVIIATDNYKIKDLAKVFGADVHMTNEHPTGTDRLAQVAHDRGWKENEIIVNVQGDEPTIPHENIHQVVKNLSSHVGWDIATLCERIVSWNDFNNPNIVKVIRDADHKALLFSRAPIPFKGYEKAGVGYGHRHIGLYAYTGSTLKWYHTSNQCELELAESLEQLRILYNGGMIHVTNAMRKTGPSVDEPEDIEKVRSYLI